MTHILTLTMNPAIDVSASVERVEPTRKLRCGGGRRDAGGGGVNVARVARRLGAEATAVYPAGGFVGQLLTELVQADDVVGLPVPVRQETREDFTALETSTGDQYRFVLPGPRLSGAEWMACLKAFAAIEKRPDLVVVSGSLPPGCPDDFYCRVGEIVRGWEVPLALDASGPVLRKALAQRPFLIKPNLHELRELSGEALIDEPSRIAAARAVVQAGQAHAVALTLGPDGALLVAREGAWRAAALPISPVSAVGAGDSFLGGMAVSIAAGEDLPAAFRRGVAAASAALLAHGTELCRADVVARLLPQVRVEEIAGAVAA